VSAPEHAAVLSAAVDELCDRFEEELLSGQRPPLDSWLAESGADAAIALPELAALDLDYRLRAGEPVTAADYFRRFPPLTADTATAVRLVAIEFRAVNTRESHSSEADFRSRYPDLAGLSAWSNGPWVGGYAAETRYYPQAAGDTPGETGTSRTEPVEFLKTFLAPPDRPGDLGRLGGYHIRDVVGAGGMGVVLTADDPQLHRTVAIKLMRPEVAAKPGARQHFLREARAAARVEHPRIVIIHHVGEWNGAPFLVMPLMAGRSLGMRLKEQPPLPLADTVRFVREAADGLAAAHARGLIHRDIKPDNIWLEETAEGTHVRLLDFGLAHADEADRLTPAGDVVGTPNYMAPEQAAGKPVDARADLFSLGCVLYELLAGRKPFSGESVTAVLKSLANDRPTPVQELAPSLPGTLCRLTMKLLEKDPANRPASAADLSSELRRIEHELAPGVDTVIIESSQPTPIWVHVPRWILGVAGMFMVGMIGVMLLTSERPRLGDHDFAKGERISETSPPPPRGIAFPPARDLEMPMPMAANQAVPLQVMAIDVERIVTTPDGDVPQGLLGKNTFTASLGDRLQVTARLTKPAYAYLIAFHPDGKSELCFPEFEDVPPPLTENPQYPWAWPRAYTLRDDPGLWAFAVVASETPLPAYHEWQEEHFHETSIWKPVAAPPAGLVWRDDGRTPVETLSLRAERPVLVKRAHEALEGPEASIRGLTTSLRTTGQAEAVSVLGFRVAPAEDNK
jgi:serine/threonine protein kinase